MNRKKNRAEVKSTPKCIRFSEIELMIIDQKLKDSGISELSEYCRQMAINGYIQAQSNKLDLNEIRECKKMLFEAKTNFNRISNLIKEKDPGLNKAIHDLVTVFQEKISKLKL